MQIMVLQIYRLYPEVTGNPKATDQLKMLEVWRGCINPLENNLRVSSVIGKWGYLEQTENDVQLMVVKKSRLWSYHTAKQQMKR